MTLKIYFDGGTSGNRICIAGDIIPYYARIKYMNPRIKLTNNQLEYYALIYALRSIKGYYKNSNPILIIHGDSQLIINHIRCKYKVKSKKLIDLYEQVCGLLGELGLPPCDLIWVPRAENLAGIELEKK